MKSSCSSLVPVFVLTLAASACAPSSQSPIGQSGDALAAQCEIVSPAAGSSVDASQDRDLSRPDIQVDVQVRVRNARGRRLQVTVDDVVAGPELLITDDGVLRLSRVTLPSGPRVSRLGCSIGDTSARAEAQVAVGAACGLRFIEPSLGRVISRADTRSGGGGRPVFNAIVEASGVPAGSAIRLELGEPGAASFFAEATVASGRAIFDVPAFEGGARLFAKSLSAGCRAVAEVRYEVAVGECASTLALPRSLNAASDLSATPGLQTRACVSTECPDGATATISIEGGADVSATVQNGQACAVITLPDGSPTVNARVSAPLQAGHVPPMRPCVDATPPVIGISYPLAGMRVGPRDDRDPSTPGVLDLAVTGAVSGLSAMGCTVPGANPRVEIRVNGAVQSTLPAAIIAGGFEAVARLPSGMNVIQLCAIDPLDNMSCSPNVSVDVALELPSLRFIAPESGAIFGQGDRPGERLFEVVLSAERLPLGTPVVLAERSAVVGGHKWSCVMPLVATSEGPRAAFNVGGFCPALPDGTHHISATAIDALGNVAESGERVIVIDTHAPELAFTAPMERQSFAQERIDVAIRAALEDGEPVLLHVNDAPAQVAYVRHEGAVFRGVAIPEGESTLRVSARDRAGNGSSASRIVARDSRAPVPLFVGIASGRVLGANDDADGDLSNGLQFDFDIRVEGERDGTRVELAVGHAAPQRALLEGGLARFAGVTLPEGESRIAVVVIDAAGNDGRAAIDVRVATGRPVIAFSTPFDGATYTAQSDVDPQAEGIQIPVWFTVSGSPALSSCRLIAIADGGHEQALEFEPDGMACRGQLTVAHGSYTLLAEAVAHRSSKSVPIHITVDTVAPALSFAAPTTETINAAAPDVSGESGFQSRVSVRADDIEVGQGVVLRVTPESTGIPALYFAAFGAERTASFDVTLADGAAVVLEAQTSDLAGNVSAVLTRRVLVDRTPPVVTFAAPSDGARLALADDDSPAQGFQHTFDVNVSGLEVGHTVALTLRGQGAADVSSTYVSEPIAAGQSMVRFQSITLPELTGVRLDVTASISDSAGNPASAGITIEVDRATGTLSWVPSSVEPLSFCSGADADAGTPGFQAALQFAAVGLPNGSEVVVTNGAGDIVGRAMVSKEKATVVATLPNGASTLSARGIKPSGNVAEAAPRSAFVDSEGPSILSLACNGDQNGDGFLNRAEDRDPGSPGSFEMDCMVTLADDSMNGRELRIASSAGGFVGTGIVTGSVALVSVSLPPGAQQLLVSAPDACGNPAAQGFEAEVEVVLGSPAASIVRPAGGSLLAQNDANSATESFECCTVSGAPDGVVAMFSGGAVAARVYANGVLVGERAIAGAGLHTLSGYTLPQGSVSIVVEALDVAGNVGVSAPVAVFVDSVAPKLTLVAPSAGDVAQNALDVVVSYRDVEPGRVIRVLDGERVLTEVAAAAGAASDTRTSSVRVLLRGGAHSLRADASDVNGNLGVSPAVALNVLQDDPVVVFESPAGSPIVVARASGQVAGSNVLVDVTIRTDAPVGSAASLFRNGVQVGVAQVGPGSPRNVALFAGVSFSNGETGTLQSRVRLDFAQAEVPCPGDHGNFCSAAVSYSVDLSAPTLTLSAPTCRATWNASERTNGAFDLTLATDAEDGRVVSLRSTVGGVEASAPAAGGQAVLSGVALAEGQQRLTFSVSDQSGNESTHECDVELDWTAPSVSSFSAARSAARRSRVTLTFAMPGDDGATGRVQSFELRYRACAAGAACAMDDAEWAAATVVSGLPAVVDGGSTVTFDVDGVPLDKALGFGLRATDNAGNVSPIASAEASTAFADESIAGVAGESEYGSILRGVRLSTETLTDLVMGRPRAGNLGGGFRVQYADGRATLNVLAAELGIGSTTARFGRSLDSVGDVDGDGYEDLLVSAPGIANAACTAGTAAPTGEAYLFFGGPNGLRVSAGGHVACGGAEADCYLRIAPPAGTGFCSFGQSVAGLGAVGTDPTPMFAIGAGDITSASTLPGRAFVYRVVGARPNVSVELVSTIVGGATDYHLGASLAGVHDVNGDGINDFVVGATRRGQTPVAAGRAYVILGGGAFDGVGGVIDLASGGAAPDDGIVPLGDYVGGDNFASSAARGGDMDGDGFNDIVISSPGSQRVYVFRGRANLDAQPSMGIGDYFTLSPPAGVQPGEVAAGQDIDGDGLADLVVGDTLAVHVYLGRAGGSAPSLSATFAQSASVSTGYPVTMLPTWRAAFVGEGNLPDIAIGRQAGPQVGIKY